MKWSKDHITCAIAEFNKWVLGLRRIARAWNVPKSTLQRRVKSTVVGSNHASALLAPWDLFGKTEVARAFGDFSLFFFSTTLSSSLGFGRVRGCAVQTCLHRSVFSAYICNIIHVYPLWSCALHGNVIRYAYDSQHFDDVDVCSDSLWPICATNAKEESYFHSVKDGLLAGWLRIRPQDFPVAELTNIMGERKWTNWSYRNKVRESDDTAKEEMQKRCENDIDRAQQHTALRRKRQTGSAVSRLSPMTYWTTTMTRWLQWMKQFPRCTRNFHRLTG